jgi:hypothetical protein
MSLLDTITKGRRKVERPTASESDAPARRTWFSHRVWHFAFPGWVSHS